jgi:hypothetical protein
MSKFNKPIGINESLKNRPDATLNYEGGLAYVPSAKTKLVTMVATSLIGENKFYTSGEKHDTELLSTIHSVIKDDPEFILKLAAYARNVLNMRSVSLVLLGEFANSQAVGTIQNARKYVEKTIRRADEIPELLAYQLGRNRWAPREGNKIPMMLKNGVARAFNNFDGYQFAKYNRDGLVTIRDALFLTHPRPKTPEQQKLFDQIVEDSLPIPETWETYISTNGSNTETWSHIAPKLPIFALVRNLRNLLKFDVDTDLYINKLTTPKVIHNSRMFPFRFFSAYQTIQEDTTSSMKQRKVLDALEEAMDISVDNITHIPGDTAIFCDLSGSMSFTRISQNSTIYPLDIASLFGAIADKICDNSIIGVFGATFDTVSVSKKLPILAKMEQIKNKNVGHSTNAYLAIQWLKDQGIKVDRILIFSDMQTYDSYGWGNQRSVQAEITKYRRQVNQNTFLHTIDLTGYGTVLMPEDDPKTNIITGWSEKILDYINMFEEGIGTMTKKIDNYEVV